MVTSCKNKLNNEAATRVGAWVFGAVFAGALMLTSGTAQADSLCTVTDPTNTPLNIRATPYGRILTSVSNGTQVEVQYYDTDSKGRLWAYVSVLRGRQVVHEGWVIREYISCFVQ